MQLNGTVLSPCSFMDKSKDLHELLLTFSGFEGNLFGVFLSFCFVTFSLNSFAKCGVCWSKCQACCR